MYSRVNWKRAAIYGVRTANGQRRRDATALELVRAYRKDEASRNRKRKRRGGRKHAANAERRWFARARAKLLNNRTYQELLLAAWLKDARIEYREQWRIGRYFADLVVGRNVVVEIDGRQHATQRQRRKDRAKDAYLVASGYRVHRIWNRDARSSNQAQVMGWVKATKAPGIYRFRRCNAAQCDEPKKGTRGEDKTSKAECI